jgi:crotonobetainyl-CoA:carnitine CoA-transferase CaiB-like acyl-CoA transferase
MYPHGSNPSALNGIRILDLADEKGMFCGKLLADMGAEVIKIERPGGDPARGIGPFAENTPHPDKSLYLWYHNTNKRGITLNLEDNEGQEIFKRLARVADAVIETFPPGCLSRLGLDYPTLSKLNPHLIMTSITNFGQTGSRKDYKSCDIVASALGGQMYVCGKPDTPPLKPYGEQSYLIASIFGAIGTLLALFQRHHSNVGQHVDISMQECIAAVIEHVNVCYLYDGVVPKRQGPLHWNNAFRLFPCRDGYILLSLFQQWDTLVEWVDSDGMAADLKDPKWQHQETRLQGIEHIIQVLERWTKTHTVAELMEQGQLMCFPWATVNSLGKLVENPQLAERGFFLEIAHPELDTCFKYPGAPYKFSQTPWQISRRAPLVGEHNEEIYHRELGLSKEKIADLISKGVI